MNYIKSLTIEGLKKFEHFDIEFDKNINIIIGENESGKSTILEAINICLNQLYRNADKSIIKELKNIKFKVGIPVCLWGLLGAFIGASISSNMEVGILRKCFGIFLIIIAIYQTYSLYKRYRKEKNRNNNTKL